MNARSETVGQKVASVSPGRPANYVRCRHPRAQIRGQRHELMRHIHAPGKEKRDVVVVPLGKWGNWLSCSNPELVRSLVTLACGAVEYCAESNAAAPIKDKAPATDIFGAADA